MVEVAGVQLPSVVLAARDAHLHMLRQVLNLTCNPAAHVSEVVSVLGPPTLHAARAQPRSRCPASATPAVASRHLPSPRPRLRPRRERALSWVLRASPTPLALHAATPDCTPTTPQPARSLTPPLSALALASLRPRAPALARSSQCLPGERHGHAPREQRGLDGALEDNRGRKHPPKHWLIGLGPSQSLDRNGHICVQPTRSSLDGRVCLLGVECQLGGVADDKVAAVAQVERVQVTRKPHSTPLHSVLEAALADSAGRQPERTALRGNPEGAAEIRRKLGERVERRVHDVEHSVGCASSGAMAVPEEQHLAPAEVDDHAL
eukprot:3645169-Rhodomonas_salina.5